MLMDRSSKVVGSRPINAIAFAHHTEWIFGSLRSPLQRRTNALERYNPALRMPRNSALPPLVKIVSASSMSNVGATLETFQATGTQTGNTQAFAVVDAYTVDITNKVDGRVATTSRRTVSEDGK